MVVSDKQMLTAKYLEPLAFPGRFGLQLEDDTMEELLQKGDVVLLTESDLRPGDVCAAWAGASPPFVA